MDYKVGTTDGKSEGLQVLGVREPRSIYLEGMEECHIQNNTSDPRIEP